MKQRRFVCLFLALMMALAALCAHAETTNETPAASVTVADMGLDLMDNSVHYPQLTGLADEAVQTRVNAAIMDKGQIETRLNRMAMLLSSPVKLRVSYTCTLMGDVFSCAILADGAVETSRSTQVWSAVNADLRTGDEITLDDLFTDAEAATAFIEGYLEEQVAPELSAHLDAGSLTPIPQTFTVSPAGLTLYYDIDDFCTLSDRAGMVTILWTELAEHLAVEDNPLLAALNVPDTLTLDDSDSREALAQTLAQGAFPGIPAALGQSVKELTDRYRELTDNDLYEGGRMFILEDGAFRQVWILTDALTDGWDNSVVNGIRADRLNLDGLCTGRTTIDAWRSVLGEPDTTLAVDDARAESWRIVPGTSDYYTLGEFRLRLHADDTGVLRSVFLMQ